MKKNNFIYKILFPVFLSLLLLPSCFAPTTGVYDFDEKRDSQFLADVFKENWYWLVTSSTGDYEQSYVDYFIKHKATKTNPHYEGLNKFRVYYYKGKPAGFLSVYKKTNYIGQILFLAVKKEFRRKGIAVKLLDYAFKMLRDDMKCKRIQLVTRANNVAARKLYTDYGFTEYGEDEKYVEYKKIFA